VVGESHVGGERTRPLILLVDDDPVLLEVLADCLREDYEVATASNGQSAVEYMEREVPDLVLLDVVMPEMSGYDVCGWMKTDDRTKDVPAIIITSLEDPREKKKAFAAGAVDFIDKPVQVEELRARVGLHLSLRSARESLKNKNLLLEEVVRARTEKLQHILDMAVLLNSERDLNQMFHLVVTQVSRILDCDRSSLFLLDSTKGELWTKAAEGIEDTISIPLGKGLVGRAAESNEPLLIRDAWDEPDFDTSWDRKFNYRTRSVICYPIRSRDGKLRGVLEVINRKDGFFDEGDLDMTAALAAQLGVSLETYDLLGELQGAFESFARTLARAVEAKHPLTAGHSTRVTEYSLILGRRIGLTERELDVLKYACLLHDIGKIGVPDRVLTKDGRFNAEERCLMNGHARWTNLILSEIHLPRRLHQVPWIASCHHEKVDGTGYPFGLKGDKIPFFSRIMAAADVFDALTYRRDYPKYDGDKVFGLAPFPVAKAFEILERDRGSHFDPTVIAAAIEAREELSVFCRQAADSVSAAKPKGEG
jgi:response regulator RpfG family c-di-GMP phosphodiesterase